MLTILNKRWKSWQREKSRKEPSRTKMMCNGHHPSVIIGSIYGITCWISEKDNLFHISYLWLPILTFAELVNVLRT